ncbi:hypothetical protein AA18895_2194 [Acetobacter ghanensis DSM 18895]|nr:hypothetical protein AA18895_2194 [Acetobacter ghanensis DSM 18895]
MLHTQSNPATQEHGIQTALATNNRVIRYGKGICGTILLDQFPRKGVPLAPEHFG